MQTVTTIGLDIATSVFQVHSVDAGGQVVKPGHIARPTLTFEFFGSENSASIRALLQIFRHIPTHIPTHTGRLNSGNARRARAICFVDFMLERKQLLERMRRGAN